MGKAKKGCSLRVSEKGVKIPFPRKTAAFTTPMKAGRVSKRLRTPESFPRASQKKLRIYEITKYKAGTVINENVIFDEFEKTISKKNKEYIYITTIKILVVMNNLSEAGLLYYFLMFFNLVKTGKYSLSNIVLLLWLETMETVRWFSL